MRGLKIPDARNLSVDAVAGALRALPNLNRLELKQIKWRARAVGSRLGVIPSAGPPLVDLFPPKNSLTVLRVSGAVFLGEADLRGLCAAPGLEVRPEPFLRL